MSVSTPIPSTVTCFKNGLSHFTFPVNFRPGLSPNKIGPLTPNTVNGSISVIPNDTNLKIHSITSENNLMIKVHYKLENQDQEGKANFSYISPGIKWTPNYLVKVNDEAKTLTIGGRATIVSSIQFLDDITLPQLSLVSGVPNISCIGESDPLVSNGIEHQRNQHYAPQARMMKSQQQNMVFGAAQGPPQAEMDSMDDSDEDFDEENNGDMFLQIKNTVAMNNTDDGIKNSESDGGSIIALFEGINSIDNGGKGIVVEEEDTGNVQGFVQSTFTRGNDDGDKTGIEAVQEDDGMGTLKIVSSTIVEGFDLEGVELK